MCKRQGTGQRDYTPSHTVYSGFTLFYEYDSMKGRRSWWPHGEWVA